MPVGGGAMGTQILRGWQGLKVGRGVGRGRWGGWTGRRGVGRGRWQRLGEDGEGSSTEMSNRDRKRMVMGRGKTWRGRWRVGGRWEGGNGEGERGKRWGWGRGEEGARGGEISQMDMMGCLDGHRL